MKRLTQPRHRHRRLLMTPFAVSAQSLKRAQARAVHRPLVRPFNQPVQGDMKTLQEQILTSDYESCWGYLAGECWGRDASIKVVGGFAKSIPDMKFDIKEVLVAGDRVIVRGEVTERLLEISSVCPERQELQDHGDRYSDHQGREDCQDLPPRETGSVPWGSFAPSKREHTCHCSDPGQ